MMLVQEHTHAYACGECGHQVQTRWHCPGCGDYDLCVNCYSTKSHPHEMVKLEPGLDAADDKSGEGGSQEEPQARRPGEPRRQAILRCLQTLLHACRCPNASCSLPSCMKMKRAVQHTKGCKRKTNGGCPVCKQLIVLCCYHGKYCPRNPCDVPFCLKIKYKLRQLQIKRHWWQQIQSLRQQGKLM